jgi:hypothetical protein
MGNGIIPDPPEGTELARWVSDGKRHERANIVTFVHPE